MTTRAPTLYLRGAQAENVDTIFAWRHSTAEWLASTYRTDQWSTPYPRERIERWVSDGSTVMAALEPDGPAVATITVTHESDPVLWSPTELAEPARYINKANVIRSQGGRRIGACLIAWARTRAAKAGIEIVRFDVWSTNHRLQEYYKRLGFTHLRTVPGMTSGALFQGPAIITPDLPVIEADDVRVR